MELTLGSFVFHFPPLLIAQDEGAAIFEPKYVGRAPYLFVFIPMWNCTTCSSATGSNKSYDPAPRPERTIGTRERTGPHFAHRRNSLPGIGFIVQALFERVRWPVFVEGG